MGAWPGVRPGPELKARAQAAFRKNAKRSPKAQVFNKKRISIHNNSNVLAKNLQDAEHVL